MANQVGERIGQQFGNYRLTRLLGLGGFADVYLSEHVYLKTQAAIKVLHAQLSQEDQESFLVEARTIARLQHPSIVPVLECGVVMSTPFLVMDYASNGSLGQRYRRGIRLTPALIVPSVKHIAAALQYAHDEGIIHRDVKPENMLLGLENEVLLSDFGIALGTQSSRSQDMRRVAGTAEYMAPEQLQGKPCPASDQYGLAIVIYEWLSGQTPFHGSFAEIASQHVLIPPPSLTKIPAVSPAVESVLMTALRKDPKQRFTCMLAFANAFEEASLEEEETVKGQSGWFAMLGMPEDETVIAQPQDRWVPVTPSFGQDSQVTQVTPDQVTLRSSTASMLTKTQTVQQGRGMDGRKVTSLSPRQHHRGASSEMFYLLTTLALLVIFSGLGLAFYRIGLYGRQSLVQSMPTVPASLTAHELQNMYSKATSRDPVLDDPLSMNDSNNWTVAEKYQGSCVFTQGALHVKVPQTNYIHICIAQASNFSNFAYQVQMTIIKGDEGGLIFRARDTNSDTPSRLDFGIDQAGSYGLIVASEGSGTVLLQRPGPEIKAGLGQTNVLTVIAQGSNVYLYVNKQYIASISDNTSSSGAIGVFAADNKEPTEVVFSNAQVWKL